MQIEQPLHFELPPDAPLHHRAAFAAARPVFSWIVGLREFRRLYRRVQASTTLPFATRALNALGIHADVDGGNIPERGPLIVLANHPHGLLDGLLLADMVGRARADVRLVVNRMLAVIPELSEFCFFVDPFEGPHRAARSRAGLRGVMKWLNEGHAVVVFPAGAVAGLEPGAGEQPADSAWHRAIGGMALATGASVLPAFIEGRNSDAFYRAGRVHPLLRTLLLPRELLKQRGRQVPVRIGRAIGAGELSEAAPDAAGATAWLRNRVEELGPAAASRRVEASVRDPLDPVTLEMEVRRLPSSARLVDAGALEVYCAEASWIPTGLQEIGRLRELTFRAVGEGTGKETDLDAFDRHYLHLFVWNRERREIAGAYRIGATDRIVREHGIAGLYTSTLFRYDERLLERLAPALELGRSFVRAEYQRNSNALLLLWKGIGRFVAQSPRYRVLFGPVSISSRYADLSQQLLMSFLEDNHRDEELSELVAAMTPPARMPLPAGVAARSVTAVADVERLVGRLERDGKGMPVLLRQYLRLNARLLGFNVDPAFGDALDALMSVDLTRVEPAMLRRYLGPQGAEKFLATHTAVAA